MPPETPVMDGIASVLTRILSRTSTPPKESPASEGSRPVQSRGTLPLWDRPTVRVRPNHRRVKPEEMETAFRGKVRELCSDAGRWPLYLWSKATGTGKTTAAMMLLDRAYGASGFDYSPADVSDAMWGLIDYRSFPRLLETIGRGEATWNSHMAGGKLTEGKVWNFIARGPLIVVDDVCEIDRENLKLGQDHRALLKRILDERGTRPTIVTSNLSPIANGGPSELSRVVDPSGIDRICDRLLSGTVIEMPGESLRWRGAKS